MLVPAGRFGASVSTPTMKAFVTSATEPCICTRGGSYCGTALLESADSRIVKIMANGLHPVKPYGLLVPAAEDDERIVEYGRRGPGDPCVRQAPRHLGGTAGGAAGRSAQALARRSGLPLPVVDPYDAPMLQAAFLQYSHVTIVATPL